MATVEVQVEPGTEPLLSVAKGNGPVNALDNAIRKALAPFYPELADMQLTDYKVRILESTQGTGARTRVLIESSDGRAIWGTVGVSDNIIDASWEALRDAVEHKLGRG